MKTSIILILLFCFNCYSYDQIETVKIPINVIFSTNSNWSKEEITKRLKYLTSVYQNACYENSLIIEIQIEQILENPDEDLQDINGYQDEKSIYQINALKNKLNTKNLPTLIYTRKSMIENGKKLTEYQAQAFVFGGPRGVPEIEYLPWNGYQFDKNDPIPFSTGNLDWNRINQLHKLNEVTIISHGYSEKNLSLMNTISNKKQNNFSVDVHELGHIILNDEGHRYTNDNIMSAESGLKFDNDQCKIIKYYHIRKNLLFKNLVNGQNMICKQLLKLNNSEINDVSFCQK